jgi:hypothetical protein
VRGTKELSLASYDLEEIADLKKTNRIFYYARGIDKQLASNLPRSSTQTLS